MSDMICWLVGGLITISIYLMLSAQLMRWLFGIVILSSTVNLIILILGRLYSHNPAFIERDYNIIAQRYVNPLPQALILTAIVIGFGLLAFALVLVRKVWREFHTGDIDLIRCSEPIVSKVREDNK